MKWAGSFWRKVVYIGIMVALVFPLAYLGMPAMKLEDGSSTPGGVIAQQRSDYKLGQADLGEIDPATETMRLAALGMNGVASAVLWDAANEYKKKSDWDNLMATLNQLSKFQPNFSIVWEHQSWNVSYNVSVEFDDFRQRYHWVKKGIDYLITGIDYNRNDTKLVTANAWMVGHKIGRSDEHIHFRKLFGQDTEFHKMMRERKGIKIDTTHGPYGYPDNWLVAREWYLMAEALHKQGNPIRGESPLLFFSHVPMQRMDFAQALEEEGILDEQAMLAWERAEKDWIDFGNVRVPTTWGIEIRLSDSDRGGEDGQGLAGQIARMRARFDALTASVRQEMIAERRKTFTADEQKAMDTPLEKRTSEQHVLVQTAEQKLAMTHEEVAERSPPEKRSQARLLATELIELEKQDQYIRNYRQIVNFNYWRTRASVEKTPTAINARKFARDGDRFYLKDADFEKAKEAYEKAWVYWGEIYDKHPELVEDANADDVFDQVKRYRTVLDHRNEPFPADFRLKKLLDYKKPGWQTSLATKVQKPEDKKPDDKKPEPPMPPEEEPQAAKPGKKKDDAAGQK